MLLMPPNSAPHHLCPAGACHMHSPSNTWPSSSSAFAVLHAQGQQCILNQVSRATATNTTLHCNLYCDEVYRQVYFARDAEQQAFITSMASCLLSSSCASAVRHARIVVLDGPCLLYTFGPCLVCTLVPAYCALWCQVIVRTKSSTQVFTK